MTAIDPAKKTVRFVDNSEIKGEISGTEIEYDYLIYAGEFQPVSPLIVSAFLMQSLVDSWSREQHFRNQGSQGECLLPQGNF